MNTNFVMPSTGYPMNDLQQNIMEVILNLSEDVGSIEQVNDALFRMFELAFPYSTHEEIILFTKIQGAFRIINQLASDNSETFRELIIEQQSYKNISYETQ